MGQMVAVVEDIVEQKRDAGEQVALVDKEHSEDRYAAAGAEGRCCPVRSDFARWRSFELGLVDMRTAAAVDMCHM